MPEPNEDKGGWVGGRGRTGLLGPGPGARSERGTVEARPRAGVVGCGA